MAVAAIFSSTGFAAANENSGQGEGVLRGIYHKNKTRLEANDFGLPLFLESFERDDRKQVDIYGIFDSPLSSVAEAVNVPANWCDIVSLHPNVKACTYRKAADAQLLTFYIGRKKPQPLEDTRRILCRYRNLDNQPGYLDISLHADKGPFATKDHTMQFEALALEGKKTFVHVSYAYSDSAALRLATKVYFATLGRGKVGFTVTGAEDNGQPVYIGGPRGAIERSAIRYYFAIQSFLHTMHSPEEGRFTLRINEWYDVTTRYQKQLLDLDKKDYLAAKTTEQADQVQLQQQSETVLQ